MRARGAGRVGLVKADEPAGPALRPVPDPEASCREVRIRQHIRRLRDDRRVDPAPASFSRDRLAGPRAKERLYGRFPRGARLGIERRAVVCRPVGPAQRVRESRLVDPVAQCLIGGSAETACHQRVKAEPIRERPDAAYRRATVVERAADPMQLAPIELPDEHAVHVARERDFLNGDIDVLPEPARAAFVEGGHRARGRGHIRVESAGVERFLHRRPIRIAGDPKRAAHRRRDELRPAPMRARPIAAEGRDGNVNERRILRFEPRAGKAGALKSMRTNAVDEEVRAWQQFLERIQRCSEHSCTERLQ